MPLPLHRQLLTSPLVRPRAAIMSPSAAPPPPPLHLTQSVLSATGNPLPTVQSGVALNLLSEFDKVADPTPHPLAVTDPLDDPLDDIHEPLHDAKSQSADPLTMTLPAVPPDVQILDDSRSKSAHSHSAESGPVNIDGTPSLKTADEMDGPPEAANAVNGDNVDSESIVHSPSSSVTSSILEDREVQIRKHSFVEGLSAAAGT